MATNINGFIAFQQFLATLVTGFLTNLSEKNSWSFAGESKEVFQEFKEFYAHKLCAIFTLQKFKELVHAFVENHGISASFSKFEAFQRVAKRYSRSFREFNSPQTFNTCTQ